MSTALNPRAVPDASRTATPSNPYFGMSPMPFEQKMGIMATHYNPAIHKIGLPLSLIHIFLMLLPGLVLLVLYNVWPGWPMILAAAIPIWTMMAPIYFMEPIQYFLALGTVGTYVGFTAGNNSNIRLPVAIATEAVMGVEPGTPEGEVVGGLAVIASQWVLVVVTLLAALLVTAVVAVLPKAITDSFAFLMPGLFGAMFVQIALQTPRYAAVAIVAALVLFFLGVPATFMTIILVVFMLVLSVILYSRGIWVPQAKQAAEIQEQTEG